MVYSSSFLLAFPLPNWTLSWAKCPFFPTADLATLTRIYYDFVLTQEDIYTRLAKLQTDESPGPDQLHPRILFETRDVITYPLFLIFNWSLETGKLPGDWKLAEVTAIYIRKALSTIEVIIDQLV